MPEIIRRRYERGATIFHRNEGLALAGRSGKWIAFEMDCPSAANVPLGSCVMANWLPASFRKNSL
jgi:hypothetical protein